MPRQGSSDAHVPFAECDIDDPRRRARGRRTSRRSFPKCVRAGHFEVRSCDAIEPRVVRRADRLAALVSSTMTRGARGRVFAADSRALLRTAGEIGLARRIDRPHGARSISARRSPARGGLATRTCDATELETAPQFFATYTASGSLSRPTIACCRTRRGRVGQRRSDDVAAAVDAYLARIRTVRSRSSRVCRIFCRRSSGQRRPTREKVIDLLTSPRAIRWPPMKPPSHEPRKKIRRFF